jgi:PAS domain S-box-containing protein
MDEKENTRELIVVDVRRYKKVKDALKSSEERYRQLFENVPIGIYRTTPDGRVIDSNPALVKMLGYDSFADLSARRLDDGYADPVFSRRDFIQRLRRDGVISGLETVWLKKDGSGLHVRENAKLVRGPGGEVFFEGTVEDISQSRQAAEAQRVRTQQLEILNCIIASGNMADSIQELLDAILDNVLAPLGFDMAAIFLYEAAARKVTVAAFRGVTRSFFKNERYMSVENMPFAQVLLRGQPVFVEDAARDIPDLARKWKWKTAACVPMLSKGRVVGAISVASCQRPKFGPEEKSILELVGKESGTLLSKLQTESDLRHSEKYYRALIDTSPDIIIVLGLDARLITVNQQFLKVGGYFYDDVIGACTYDFVEGLDRLFLERKTSAFIRKGAPSGSNYLFRKKDGGTVPLEVAANLLYDDAGRPAGILAIGRDIRERLRSEEQLHFLSSISENISDAITVTDLQFRITYMNKVAEKFFGYRLDEVKGKTPGMFNAEPEAERIQEKVYRTVSSGRTYLGESLNRRKDGSTFVCEYQVMPLKDSRGRIYAYSSLQRDVSERKRAQEEVRSSEETFRRTFEAIPDPAYIWTRRGNGRLVLDKYNRAAARITRGGIKDYLGVEAEKLFVHKPEYTKKIRTTLSQGKAQFSEDVYQYRTTGETKWLQSDYVKTSENNVLVITKDISERKEAESKLLAYQEQLRAMSSEMLLIEERERRRIASELHDQIGQNLALCKLKVAALEKGMADPAGRADLAAVRLMLERSIQDARSLIFDLSPPVLYELGLVAALEWLAERIQEQFRVQVVFQNRSADPRLDIDQQVILFQVVRELLVNVGKHSGARRSRVVLSRLKTFFRIQVSDDGVGFDAAKIFSQKEASGGFGFFSMRERLNYLGGRLDVRSRPGHGSRIALTVPLRGTTAPTRKVKP